MYIYNYSKIVTMSFTLSKEQIEQLLEPLNYGFYTTIELYEIYGCYDFHTFLTNILDIYITIYFECDKYKMSDIDNLIEDKIQSLMKEAIIMFLTIAQTIGLEYKFGKNKFQLMSPVEDIITILSITHSKKYVIETDVINMEYIRQLFQECMNIVKITVIELHKINAIYKLI